MTAPRHLGTLKVASHDVRVTFDPEARGGTYSPELHFSLTGPNGSPNGTGPKPWPAWLRRLSMGRSYDWGGLFVVRVPHLRWHYPMGKVRTEAYKLNHRVLYRLARGRLTVR